MYIHTYVHACVYICMHPESYGRSFHDGYNRNAQRYFRRFHSCSVRECDTHVHAYSHVYNVHMYSNVTYKVHQFTEQMCFNKPAYKPDRVHTHTKSNQKSVHRTEFPQHVFTRTNAHKIFKKTTHKQIDTNTKKNSPLPPQKKKTHAYNAESARPSNSRQQCASIPIREPGKSFRK